VQIKRLVTSIALAFAAVTSAHAVTFNDFRVDPTLTGTTTIPPAFDADKIVGGYNEVITFTGLNTFSVTLKWEAGQFWSNDGANQVSPLTTGLGTQYGLYAILIGSGTFSQAGTVTTFNMTSGNVEMWYDDINADPLRLTGLTLPGAGGGAVTKSQSADDILLATGSVVAPSTGKLDISLNTCDTNGNGTIDPGEGINCGSFGQSTTIDLTSGGAQGNKFFVLPSPFYQLSFQSGQLNNFTIGGTQTINGSLDIVFTNPIPEPATLTLVGLSLLGLAAARKRKAA